MRNRSRSIGNFLSIAGMLINAAVFLFRVSLSPSIAVLLFRNNSVKFFEIIKLGVNNHAFIDKFTSDTMYYVVGTVMVIVMVLGILENLTIIYTYITFRKIRTVENLFIAGIATSDIGQAILGVPFVVLSSFSKQWIFGSSACQYYAFITTFLGISQVAMLTSLSLDRYFIIVRCDRKLSKSFCVCSLTIVTSFLFGLCWALGPLLGWSSYEEEIKGIACSVSWEIKDTNHFSYTISLFTFGWFIPLFTIGFSYISITWIVSYYIFFCKF